MNSYAAWVKLVITIISFLLATLHWVEDFMFSLFYIQIFITPKDRILIRWKLLELGQIESSVALALLLINDGVITWRAWVLCSGQRRWLMIGPIALLCGTAACSCALLGLSTSMKGYIALVDEQTSAQGILANFTGGLSLASNVLSTLLIGERLWSNRKEWCHGLGSRWSVAQKILLLLVESGVFYAALQLSTIFTTNEPSPDGSPNAFFHVIFWTAYVQITAMLPTVIMLLVHHRLSVAEVEHFPA